MFHMKGTKQNGVGPMPNGKISGLSGMAKGTMMLYIYIYISVGEKQKGEKKIFCEIFGCLFFSLETTKK